ncbi:MAG: cellulase family glycosylhydrolase [Oscillospiraceae bacterium]|jgi:endoglycosylceramidase|nr:cellulase family glycosylhydrolase [Oscillospiraceae bacterium]
MQPIGIEESRFLDPQGREHIFHGLNLKNDSNYVNEHPPLGHLVLLDEAFFRRSAELGFRVLRLGLCWESIEPEKGQYNEALLQKVDEIFTLAETYGVYIFLDMHQDLYSSFGIATGNGMPSWATLSDGCARKPTKFVWAEGYFWSKAVHRAFDNFWANTPVLGKGIQEHFTDVWQLLARRYGERPALFGFDILNEPFPGSPGGKVFRKLIAKLARVCLVSPKVHRMRFFKTALRKQTRGHALDVLTPEVLYQVTQGGAAENILRRFYLEQYSPFLTKVTKAIREITPKGVIFIEHCYYSNIAVPFSAALPEGEAVCYSPHGYDFTVDTPAYAFANNERAGALFAENRRAQQRLNVPVLVGEWGGGGEGESFFPHIEYLMNLFDAYAWSNAYFTYGDGFFDQPIIRVISRPYPMAVNGRIRSFSVDPAAKTFTLEYAPQAAAHPTEIYLPRGVRRLDAGADADVRLDGHVLSVTTKADRIVVWYD